MLIFAAHIECEDPPTAIRGESVIRIDSLLVRAPVIVNDGLSEMTAIVERGTINTSSDGINRFKPRRYFGFTTARSCFQIAREFFLQRIIKFRRLSRVPFTIERDAVAGLFHQMRALNAGPRALSQKCEPYV